MPFLDINVGTSGRTEYNPWTQKCIRRKSSNKRSKSRSKSKPRVSFAVEVPTTGWDCLPVRPSTPFHSRSPLRNMLQRGPNDLYNNHGYAGDGKSYQDVAHAYDPAREYAELGPEYREPNHTPAPQYERPMNTLALQYPAATSFPPPRYDESGRPYQEMGGIPMADPPLSRLAYHGAAKPINARHDDRRRSSLPDLTCEPRYRVSPPVGDDRHSHSEIYSRSLLRGRTLSRTPLPGRSSRWQEDEYELRHNTRPRSRSRSRRVYARTPREEDYVKATRAKSIPRSKPAPFREPWYNEDNRPRVRNKYANSFGDSYDSETSTTVSDGSYTLPSGTRCIFAAPRRRSHDTLQSRSAYHGRTY